MTLGCLAQDFYPGGLTFEWTAPDGTKLDSESSVFAHERKDKFTGVSVITVSGSTPLLYKCSVTHPGGNKSVQVTRMPFYFIFLLLSSGTN